MRAFFIDGFPGAEFTGNVEQVEKDCVVLTLTLHGHQNGRFMGIPATGREVHLPVTLVCRLQQQRIRRVELRYDTVALLQQLGLAL